MLPAPVPVQPFEMVPSGDSEFAEISDSIDLIQLPSDNLPQISGACSSSNGTVNAVKDVLGASSTERAYHGQHYNAIRDSSQSPVESVDRAHRSGEGYMSPAVPNSPQQTPTA
jgi:hypothetical protein